jgi:hypothetical protein
MSGSNGSHNSLTALNVRLGQATGHTEGSSIFSCGPEVWSHSRPCPRHLVERRRKRRKPRADLCIASLEEFQAGKRGMECWVGQPAPAGKARAMRHSRRSIDTCLSTKLWLENSPSVESPWRLHAKCLPVILHRIFQTGNGCNLLLLLRMQSLGSFHQFSHRMHSKI